METVIENAENMGKPDLGPTFRPDNGAYQKLVDHCKDLYELFSKSSYREAKIKEIQESRKVYEQKADPKSLPWDYTPIVLPLTTITCDNTEPRIVAGFIGKSPVVRFQMEGVQEQDEETKALQEWWNQELIDHVKIEARAMAITHTILLEGTWYGLPRYDRQEITRRDYTYDKGQIAIDRNMVAMDPRTGQPVLDEQGQPQQNPRFGKPITKDDTDVLYEGGRIDTIPFTDVLCADNLGTMEEWKEGDKGIMWRPTYAELQRSKGKTGYLADRIGPWLVSQKTGRKIAENDQTPDQQANNIEVTGKEIIRCVNWYITYPINRIEDAPEEEQEDFTEERILATIALDSGVLIRLCPLRDLNFANECPVERVRLYPEEGRSYGTSKYGKLKAVQDGASDFFNQVLNIALLCMLPWYFFDESAGMRGDTELYPGKGVPVDNVKGILIPDFFKLNPANYLVFIKEFMDLWERQGNVASPQVGKPAQGEKTATEIMAVIQESNIAFDYASKTSKDEFVGVIKTLYDLYYQYMPFNKTMNYGGKEMPIPRQQMRQKVKFSLSGSTATANKMIERKEAEELDGLAAGNPLMNPMETLKDRLQAYGKTQLDKYIKPEARQLLQALINNPELPQVVQKYLMEKAKIAKDAGLQPKQGGKAA